MTELYFKGKEFVYNHHLAVPHRPLVPDAAKGIGDPDLSGNLIIQGDNLHALKSLLPTHAGKVDCIFIDPPYNTGNENWRYNDNVNAPMIRDWLDENPVGVEDGLRHDKWCAMMWPRLKLLHELLADDGVMFICIDDNEQHHARMLIDEIFGSKNFIANVTWVKRYTRSNNAQLFYSTRDHVLVYRRSEKLVHIKEPRNSEADSGYTNPDNDARGPWITASYVNPALREKRKNLVYQITRPSDGIVIEHPTHAWKYSQAQHLRHIKEQRIWWGRDGKAEYPRLKLYLSEAKDLVPVDVWNWDEVGSSDDGSRTLKNIFSGIVFENPKPVALVQKVLSLMPEKNINVLDSFAGSGTTAHAVLKANAEDGGSRKFILVEMEDDIADPVTAERVRRVITGYEHDGKTTAGPGGNFTFCTLGDPIDLDRILTGEALPAYDALAPVLYHMATSRTLDPASLRPDDHYVGAAGDEHVWMLYRPDLDWLKSDAAALTLSRAKAIQATAPDKRHLVFAPARFVSEAVLREHGLNIAYVPFPNALYQIAREG